MNRALATLVSVSLLGLAGCGDHSRLPRNADTGPQPTLPEPTKTLIPTVNVAPAKGWPDGVEARRPRRASRSTAFATGLDHPALAVRPAERRRPGRRNERARAAEAGRVRGGVKGWFMKHFMKRAGAATPSANRITLLRDADGDGVAEVRSAFLEGLNSPFGMALVGNDLYVANTDALVRFPYTAGATQITAPGTKVVDLPGGAAQPSLDEERRSRAATAAGCT